jgi:hypothetical protein
MKVPPLVLSVAFFNQLNNCRLYDASEKTTITNTHTPKRAVQE